MESYDSTFIISSISIMMYQTNSIYFFQYLLFLYHNWSSSMDWSLNKWDKFNFLLRKKSSSAIQIDSDGSLVVYVCEWTNVHSHFLCLWDFLLIIWFNSYCNLVLLHFPSRFNYRLIHLDCPIQILHIRTRYIPTMSTIWFI